MNTPESIIMYRSRQEQMLDEYYWDLIQDNPESFLLFMKVAGFLGLALLLYWGASSAWKAWPRSGPGKFINYWRKK